MTTEAGGTDAPSPSHLAPALLYKAWLETRGRFLAAAALLTLLSLATVLRAPATIASYEAFHHGEPMSYALYFWLSLSHGYLQFIWIICAVVLGLGGLVREQALGTSGFTLSLPVSRASLVLTRTFVGAGGLLGLAVLPCLLVALLSPLEGYHFPIGQAVLFGLLLGAAGMVFHTLGLLLSHVLPGEYSGPGVGLAVIAAFYLLTRIPALDLLNVFELMSGADYMSPRTLLLVRAPVLPLLAWLGVAAVLAGCSVLIAIRRDF